jgi:HlyD family secretion protein
MIVLAIILAGIIVAIVLTRGGRDGSDEIVASGTVEATAADIGFAVSGRILEVLVEEGDTVVAAQPVARLERAELEARRAAAAAQVAAARALLSELIRGPRAEELAQARAVAAAAQERREDAQRDAERTRRLFEGGAVSREARDKANTQLVVAEAQYAQAREQLAALEAGTRRERIAAARAQLEQAQAAQAQVDALLDNAVASAPWKGLVTVRHREPGETVVAGAPVATILDPDNRWVRIYVPEADIARIAHGQAARISADGFPDRTYTGEVVHIAAEAEFTPRNVQTPEERTKLVYAVKVRITADPEHHLKPGLPVDVRLTPRSAS